MFRILGTRFSVFAAFFLTLQTLAGGPVPSPTPKPATSGACNPHLSHKRGFPLFLDEVLRPVLAENAWKAAQAVVTGSGEDWIKIATRDGKSEFLFTFSAVVDPNSLGKTTAFIRPDGSGGTVGLNPIWLDAEGFEERRLDLQGLVRSVFVGNSKLHPHLFDATQVADGKRAVPSSIQFDSIRGAEALERIAREDDRGRVLRIGLQAPGAGGKTFISVYYLREMWKPEIIIFYVNDGDILGDAEKTYARELGLKADEVQRLYGHEGKQTINPNAKLFFVSRSTGVSRTADLLRHVGDRRVALVFDEAHHLGADADRATGTGAEYRQILQAWDHHVAGAKSREGNALALFISATLFHESVNLVRDRFFLGMQDGKKGKIYGPLLTPQEVDQLQRGVNLPDLSIVQFRRSAARGWTTPIRDFDLPDARVFDERDAIELRTQDAEGRIYELPMKLLGDFVDGMIQIREPNAFDRGILVVHGTQMANLWKQKLNEAFQARGENAEARAFHSGQGSDHNAISWFRDEGDYRDTAGKHKILVVIRKVNEGVDIPQVNLITIAKNLGRTLEEKATTATADPSAIRQLLQIIYRGGRVGHGKYRLRLIDYSGLSAVLNRMVIVPQEPETGEPGKPKKPGGPSRPTRVEATDRPVQITDRSEIFLDSQAEAAVLVDPRLKWLLEFAPFDDTNKSGISPLAMSLIRYYQSRAHQLPELLSESEAALGKEVTEIFSRMFGMYQEFERELREWEGVVDKRELETIGPELRKTFTERVQKEWFRLRTLVKGFDPYQNRTVLLSLAPRGEAGTGHAEVETLAKFLTDLFTVARDTTHPLEPSSAKAGLQVLHAGWDLKRENYLIQVYGSEAYSLLSGELGYHGVKLAEREATERSVAVRVVPLDPSADTLTELEAAQKAALEAEGSRKRVLDVGDFSVVEPRSTDDVHFQVTVDITDLRASRQSDQPAIARLKSALRRGADGYLKSIILDRLLPRAGTGP